MGKIFFVLLLSFSALYSFAQNTIVWKATSTVQNIGDRVLVLEDKNHQYTIEEVSSPAYNSKFTLSDQQVLNYANTSFYWLKFKIKNNTDTQLLLELAQPIIAEVDFFYKDASSGKWAALHAGFNIPLAQKPYKHQYQLFPLAKGSQEYYVRLQSRNMAIPVKIWAESVYEEKSSKQKIIFGIFSGLMFFVVLTNLLFFFTLRKFPHLHYAILVLFYYMIATNVEGFIVYVFPTFDLFYGMFIFSIINMPIGVYFAMLFLDTQTNTPKLNKIGIVLICYYLSFWVWHQFLSDMDLAYVTNVNGLLVVLIMASFGIQVGRNGNKMGYYFFVSYMLFFVLAVLDVTSRLTGSPPYIFDLSYISIGFLVEAIALSYLLTLRFDWERKSLEQERLLAQSLLLEQTKENERIIREQNIMLEQKVAERTKELMIEKKKVEKTLSQLQTTQDQLIQKEKLASLGELTAGIAHEIQNPLNFVNNFAEVSVEIIEDAPQPPAGASEDWIPTDIPYGGWAAFFADLSQNLQKINYHGKRASNIVKGMLEHSRTSTGDRQLINLNTLCDEYLRLSYHGMRAKDKSFNANFELLADENLPQIEIMPQEIGRVILNLVNNAFYAVNQRLISAKQNHLTYSPKVTIVTQTINNHCVIKVQDNGTGMSDEVKAKLFQPFFTTKPTGEGTGLGLSLSYDIVTKGHGGTIEVESTEGEGTTFVIKLPISKS